MRRVPILMTTVLVALIVLAGCSSGGDGESADAASDTPTADDSDGDGGADEGSDQGDGSADSSPTSDLAETPIPFPDGVTFELARTEAGLSLYYPAEDADRLIAFYDEWTSAESDPYERLEPSATSTSWSYVSESDATLRIIAIEQNFDGGGNFGTVTSVQLIF